MEPVSRGGAEAIRTASRVRQWAVLGSKANITQFGFQRYLRTDAADEKTKAYLVEGRDLFDLLQEGEEVTTKGITSAHQLAAVNALEPIQAVDTPLKTEEIRNILETIDTILDGKKPERRLVEEALENAFKASDAYTLFAFNEIAVRERQYTRRNSTRP